MKKKIFLLLSVFVLFIFSFVIVKAVDAGDPLASVETVELGESTHGDVELSSEEIINLPLGLPDGTSNYKVKINFNTEEGYYVKNLEVVFGTDNLKLGMNAGSEQGNFFRETPFYPLKSDYEFFIPEAASSTNKVQVKITYAKKDEVNIYYQVKNGNEYGNEELLVGGYLDGDIVLPAACTSNDCRLLFKFGEDEYTAYKTSIQRTEGDETYSWISAEAVIRKDNVEERVLDYEVCDDSTRVCSIIAKENFDELSVGKIHLGYTDINVFLNGFVGFEVLTDATNFNDILHEVGVEAIGFTEDNLSKSIVAFFGTKELYLTKKTPVALLKTGESNCGIVTDFDTVTGSGFGWQSLGYQVDPSTGKGVTTIKIDSYYQDQMKLELTIKNGDVALFNGKKVEININRFAFGGNGMQLLEVDAQGRNCNEQNNGNTCASGVYYSTQYRGILSAFYTVEGAANPNPINNFYEVVSVGAAVVTLQERNENNSVPRNTDFDPYAVVLFYDSDDMIIETKTIELNAEVYMEGYVSSNTFNTNYDGYEITADNTQINEVEKYVFFPHNGAILPAIKDIAAFDGRHLNDSIMHDIVLIGKQEAKDKGIKKIAIFLVNGKVEENDIPTLTFGTGQGVIMEVRGDE